MSNYLDLTICYSAIEIVSKRTTNIMIKKLTLLIVAVAFAGLASACSPEVGSK